MWLNASSKQQDFQLKMTIKPAPYSKTTKYLKRFSAPLLDFVPEQPILIWSLPKLRPKSRSGYPAILLLLLVPL